MGTNCGDHGSTNFDNPCSVNTDNYEIPNFCQNQLRVTDSSRDQLNAYCQNLSPVEWVVDTVGGTCYRNDCEGDYSVDYGFGCCNGCCGIPDSKTLLCNRTGFTGDPVTCCVQDLGCNPEPGNTFNPKNCFSDTAKHNTCGLNLRDAVTTSCQSTMQNWCTGADLEPNDTTWLQRWTSNVFLNGTLYNTPCLQNLNRNLYNTLQNPDQFCHFFPQGLPITNQGFAYGEQLLASAIAKYVQQGFILGTTPGSAGYNTFQDLVLSLCQQNPGICVNSLKTGAASLNIQRLTENPIAAQLFGCYLPDADYATYIDLYGVPKQCTPMCNRAGVVPLVGPDGITPVPCSSSSCIIDNVTISLSQSNVGGSINFNQVCKNCSSTDPNVVVSCSCLIEGNSVLVANSQIGGNINFNQQCTGAIQCFTTDALGNRVETDCSASTDPYAEQIALQNQATATSQNNGFLITIAIIIFAILLIAIIYILVRKR